MKYCPQCRSSYSDETLRFCLQDGTPLLGGGEYGDRTSSAPTDDFLSDYGAQNETPKPARKFLIFSAVAVLFLILGFGGALIALKFFGAGDTTVAGVNANQNNARPNANRSNNANQAKNANASPTATPTPTSSPVATPDKAALARLVDDELEKRLAEEDLVEGDKASRKTIYGDLDGDGDEDAATAYGFEYKEGNNYGAGLIIFTNDNGKFGFAADEVIGGKMNRNVEMKSIADGKINFDTTAYGPDDGACCPSVKGKTAYVLRGNKLVEIKK